MTAALPDSAVGELLAAWSRGDGSARERLIPIVYGDLRRLAAQYLRKERSGHTLQPTALVNEVFLRLVRQRTNWQSRGHFMAVAARAMRRLLVDYARRRQASKRGGEAWLASIEEAVGLPARDEALVSLDEALGELALIDPRQAQIVDMRFFAGFSVEETAEALDLSPATVKREWAVARAWLHRQVASG